MSEERLPVLVLGAARSGLAAARLLLGEGERVVLYDRDPAALESLDLDEAVERLSGPELPSFAEYSRVVASPGVPLRADPRIEPEVDLASAQLHTPLIGVTGTNGKSTVAVLIGEMLRESGFAVAVGGNIGTPLCALVGQPLDWIVAELSSFQLEHARRLRARIAVLLNLAPDHLDRHGTLAAYGAAKARLSELQSGDDLLVVNADDAWARATAERSPARVIQFSSATSLEDGASLDGSDLVLRNAGSVALRMATSELSPACRAPLANALAASLAAHAAGAAPDALRRALAGFAGLPHRSQLVCTRRGVRYVNDSKATNPAAAMASLQAQTRPTWWLAGGRNKQIDLSPLASAAAGTRAAIVYGEAASELAGVLEGVTDVVRVDTLAAAVEHAARSAQSDDVVLLSPACASFDQYRSFEQRGEHFAELARGLTC
jgi:UDP-N-acetylmuramoylalanine--D-glutamate ligase